VTLIDVHSAFGARVAAHLRDDIVVWFTTVAPGGTPQPSPVWFLWDGADEVVVYSRESQRTTNIAGNPRVALNFRGDEEGSDIVILTGEARVDAGRPPCDQVPAYLAKYADPIANLRKTPAEFAAEYPVCVRITLTRLRGF
jgi:PPOX class probable F420-dependent enzyme